MRMVVVVVVAVVVWWMLTGCHNTHHIYNFTPINSATIFSILFFSTRTDASAQFTQGTFTITDNNGKVKIHGKSADYYRKTRVFKKLNFLGKSVIMFGIGNYK